MNSILFIGYSRLVQWKLITAVRNAGFEQIEVSSKRNIEEIPNIDLIHKGYEKALERKIDGKLITKQTGFEYFQDPNEYNE